VKQRVIFRTVSLSLSDFDGMSPGEIFKYLTDTCREHSGGVADVSCRLRAQQYYEEVEMSLELSRVETDEEYNKRMERVAKARERNAKKAAAKRIKNKAAKTAAEEAEYQTYLDLKKKFEGVKNAK